MATCIDCDADVLWLRFADSGRAIAVNERRVLGGNIEIEDAGAVRVAPSKMDPHFLPHVAVCPEARRQREEERRAREQAKRSAGRRQLGLFK